MKQNHTIAIIVLVVLGFGGYAWWALTNSYAPDVSNSSQSNTESTSQSQSSTNSNTNTLVQNSRVDRQNDDLFEISLKTLDGTTTTLDQWKGVPLVVNVWASWCPFCTDELPAFAQLQKQNEDIKVIAVNRKESVSKIQTYLSDTEDISQNDLTFLRDPKDRVHQSINGFSMPETVFIAPDGTTVFHKRGPLNLEEMQALVDALQNLIETN